MPHKLPSAENFALSITVIIIEILAIIAILSRFTLRYRW